MITWNLWKSLPHLKLWEAVALVLELEPSDLKPLREAWMVGAEHEFSEARSFPSQAKREDFEKALSLAERATSAAGPVHLLGIRLRSGLSVGMSMETAEVALPEVVAFFSKLGWPAIPPELLDLVQVPKPASATSDSDLTTRERGSLLKILYGVATSAPYNYDPNAKRSEAAVTIASACAAAGCPIDEDTVRRYLREAAHHFGEIRR